MNEYELKNMLNDRCRSLLCESENNLKFDASS